MEAFTICYPLQDIKLVCSVKLRNWGRKAILGSVKRRIMKARK
jgi:hypothetical protein